jgi:hypothetical protein
MDGFLHDIRPHQTAHPPVCANRLLTKKTGPGWSSLLAVSRSVPVVGMPVFVLHFEQNHPLRSDHRRLPVRHTRRMFSEHGHHPIHHTQRFSPNRCLHPIRQIRSSPPTRRLHPIHHVRCPHLPTRSVLPNAVADPVVRPLSALFTIRTRSRILRSPAGFHLPRAAYPSVPTLPAPCSPTVGSPRTLMLSSERALVLRSFDDLITRFVFRSVPRTLPKRYAASPTSASVPSASDSSATFDAAILSVSFGTPHFPFPVRGPPFSTRLLRFRRHHFPPMPIALGPCRRSWCLVVPSFIPRLPLKGLTRPSSSVTRCRSSGCMLVP